MFTKPRFEFKYVIDMNTMLAFHNRLDDIMFPDPNAPHGGYHVNSIYYDTQDLSCYFEKLDGEKRRFKVRTRWYGEIFEDTTLSNLKLFVEIKHRNNDMNFKNRVSVSGDLLPEFAENQDRLSHLGEVVKEDQAFDAATIEHITNQKSFLPICIVSYFRRPLMCRIDPRLRITFDTNLRTHGVNNFRQVSSENGIQVLPKDLAILEIKFNWAMPIWLNEICREVGLNLRRYSKYAASIEKLYPDYTERAMRFQEALR